MPRDAQCYATCEKQVGINKWIQEMYQDPARRSCSDQVYNATLGRWIAIQAQPSCKMESMYNSCTDLQSRVIGAVVDWHDVRGPDYNCTWYEQNSILRQNADNTFTVSGACATYGADPFYKQYFKLAGVGCDN
jgi:hypothetical protein